MQGDKERCFEAGMNGYVSKPLNVQALYEVLERTGANHAPPATAAGAAALPDYSERPPLDRERAALMMDNDDGLVQGMLMLFLQLAPERVGQLEALALRGDYAGVAREAQRLRKAAERIAADCIADAARMLHVAAEQANPGALRTGLAVVQREVQRLRQATALEAAA
jgi:HPt (histidine-containing phosphotransfer) domain-containing protein